MESSPRFIYDIYDFQLSKQNPLLDRHLSEMYGRFVDLEYDYVHEIWH